MPLHGSSGVRSFAVAARGSLHVATRRQPMRAAVRKHTIHLAQCACDVRNPRVVLCMSRAGLACVLCVPRTSRICLASAWLAGASLATSTAIAGLHPPRLAEPLSLYASPPPHPRTSPWAFRVHTFRAVPQSLTFRGRAGVTGVVPVSLLSCRTPGEDGSKRSRRAAVQSSCFSAVQGLSSSANQVSGAPASGAPLRHAAESDARLCDFRCVSRVCLPGVLRVSCVCLACVLRVSCVCLVCVLPAPPPPAPPPPPPPAAGPASCVF